MLFERGRFDASAGDLTYTILVAYAVALPFYVCTEIVTRGLIALRDTRTPLVTNSLQILGRWLLLSLLIETQGAVTIPIAFAVTSALETLGLSAVLFIRLRQRRLEPELTMNPLLK
jgi:putative peptidoglycan lipid II flippase